MKKNLNLLLAILGLALISCQSELVETQQLENLNSSKFDYYSIISSLGYSTDDIMENDSLFVISDVIVLHKKELRKLAEKPQTRITTYSNLLPLEKQHIKLDEYEIADANNSILLTRAAEEWNSVPNCNILFSHGTEYASEVFYSMSVYISDDPSWGFSTNDPQYSFIQVSPVVASSTSTGTLAINTSHSTWQSYSEDQKKWAIVHALGLLIGLKPTDETDSIMYNRYYTPNWSSFSDTDKSELMSKYPLTVKSFDLDSSVSSYVSDIEYTFTPNIEYYKQFDNVTFDYEVQNLSSIVSHRLIQTSNNAAKISFYSAGTYTIKCRIRTSDIIFAEASKTIEVTSDTYLPQDGDITLNQPFNIRWNCEVGETLNCSIVENLFGNNPNDYVITKISSSEYTIKLCDYGYYTITLTKNNNNGTVIDCKEIHIKRFYRPELSFPDFTGTLDDFDFRMDVFEIGFICPENTANMIVTSYNPSYNIVVGDGTILAERLYLKRYEKFYRNAFFPPEPVCKGPATDVNTLVELTFTKGSSAVIAMPEGRNGYFSITNGWLNYKGYYAVIIPEDNVTIIPNN